MSSTMQTCIKHADKPQYTVDTGLQEPKARQLHKFSKAWAAYAQTTIQHIAQQHYMVDIHLLVQMALGSCAMLLNTTWLPRSD